jgi:hypothetical protein
MHPKAEAVAAAALDAGVTVEVREFPEGTRTAADAAAAIGVESGRSSSRSSSSSTAGR